MNILLVNNNTPFNKHLIHVTGSKHSFTCKTKRDLHELKTPLVKTPELLILNCNVFGVSEYDSLKEREINLKHTGIIVLCENVSQIRKIEESRKFNLLIALTYNQSFFCIPKILNLINRNKTALLIFPHLPPQRISFSGSAELENTPEEAKWFITMVSNVLHSARLITARKKTEMRIALTEMLMNAIEHGNCSISFEQKADCLKNDMSIIKLIEEKMEDPQIRKKTLTIDFTCEAGYGIFTVKDQGNGFNWKTYTSRKHLDYAPNLNGRGICITQKISDSLSYNDRGNEVTLGFRFDLLSV
ncbi:cyclic nucleotide-binding protein [Chitinispirillum alkaliphilum]|nr:cyclic nucleotide-binding protein [Chitinispirillum alkaliphilum]